MLSRLRTIAAVPILLAAACQPTAGPNGPDTAGAAVTMPCDAVVAACTPEQLRAWEQAEQARIDRRIAGSATGLVEGTRLWGGSVPILLPGDEYDERDNDPIPNAPACYLNGTGCSESELHEWKENEEARIAAEQQASQPVYDSLLVVWDSYLDDFPQGESQFLICDPLQYTGEVRIVGPEGADMSIGPHKLRIPPGALTERVVITGVMPVSLLVSVQLSPHGLQLAPGVKLDLSYKHCVQPEGYEYRVAYIDANGNVLEWPVSTNYSQYGEVTADIDHFSKYAVAY